MIVLSAGPFRAPQLNECFIIPLDQAAFLAAASGSNATVADFFFGELVMSEGAPVACKRRLSQPPGEEAGWCALHDIGVLKDALLRAGLLIRLHTPQQVLRGIEAELKSMPL